MKKEQLLKWWDVIVSQKEGKTIQMFDSDSGEWRDVEDPYYFENRVQYRVKPEPELIPYDYSDWESLIGETIILKNGKSVKVINEVNAVGVGAGNTFIYFAELLKNYVFLDGKPLGKIK